MNLIELIAKLVLDDEQYEKGIGKALAKSFGRRDIERGRGIIVKGAKPHIIAAPFVQLYILRDHVHDVTA